MSKKEKDIQKILINSVFDDIYSRINYIDEEDFYFHMIQLFDYDNPDYYKEDLYAVCVEHGIRVWLNAETIMKYHEDIGYRKYSNRERNIIKTASIFHDIGKLYKKKNHAKWGSIIMEQLFIHEFKNNGYVNISKSDAEEIYKIIKFHGDKEEYRDRIDILTKVVRDADRFDEMCGDSLVETAIANIRNYRKNINEENVEKANLNYLDYRISDMIMNNRNDNETKAMMKREININVDYELYLHLLNQANHEYDRRTQFHRLRDKHIIRIY